MLPDQILRNRYKIIKALGSGNFGITYLAEDLDLPDHPLCVVKNLRQSQSLEELQAFISYFNKEAKALYRLGREHNQIPQLFAHFEEGGEFYIVQEYIDGHDLSHEIFPGNKLNEAQVTQLLKEILEVLTITHNKNIIHRDIKAQNLMRRNSDGKIVLIDFGTVKEISQLKNNSQDLTNSSFIVGTHGYMPIEQLNGYPNLSSDIYAVGMLGIYALTGIRPQDLPKNPNTFEVIWRDRVSISSALANVLDKMVRSNFNERYQTAGEALQALTTQSSESTQQPPPPSSISRPSHFSVANLRLIGGGVIVSFLFGMGLLFMTFSRKPTTDVGRIPDTGEPTPNSEEATLVPKQPATQPALITPTISSTKQLKTNAETCPETPVSSNLTRSPDREVKGEKYYGKLDKNGKYKGCGTLILANGDTYQGTFKEGKYQGNGTFIKKVNGIKYIGEFSNNMYNGMGKLIYSNDCQYEGEFKNNQMEGQGICKSPNGSSQSVTWHQGKIEGKNKFCC